MTTLSQLLTKRSLVQKALWSATFFLVVRELNYQLATESSNRFWPFI